MSAELALMHDWEWREPADRPTAIELEGVSFWYGEQQALADVSLRIPARTVVALIGPSGCGKSTLLRTMNRTNELMAKVSLAGSVRFRGQDIYKSGTDVTELRECIGMVFQRPNPFRKSIFDNVAWGPRSRGIRDRGMLDGIVESSLKAAALWDTVAGKLHQPAQSLSGGQQQRLCIARALAVGPEILLMDEPCSALDPIATQRIEDLIDELKERYAIVIVTHNMQQAARISDLTAFLLAERSGGPAGLVEFGPSGRVFTAPTDERTEAYITGRFG